MLIYLSIVDLHKPKGCNHLGSVLVDVPEISGESHYDIKSSIMPAGMKDRFRPHIGRLIVGKPELEKVFGPLVDGFGKDI